MRHGLSCPGRPRRALAWWRRAALVGTTTALVGTAAALELAATVIVLVYTDRERLPDVGRILALMADQGVLSASQMASALARPLPSVVPASAAAFRSSAAVQHVLEELTTDWNSGLPAPWKRPYP